MTTYSELNAMMRSHRWKIYRGKRPRECYECGDTYNSKIRYCPGVTKDGEAPDA